MIATVTDHALLNKKLVPQRGQKVQNVFQNKLHIGSPNEEERRQIILKFLKNPHKNSGRYNNKGVAKLFSEGGHQIEETISKMVQLTDGLTPCDLRRLTTSLMANLASRRINNQEDHALRFLCQRQRNGHADHRSKDGIYGHGTLGD